MCRGVRVATNDGHTRQTQTLLGTYYMDNAVIRRHHAIMRQSEIGCILRQHIYLIPGNRILNRFILIVCRRIMIRHTENLPRTETLQTSGPHAFKGLWRCHLMTIESVDIQLRGAVGYLLDYMPVPYFIKKCIHSSVFLNLLIQSIYASTEAVTMSVLAPKP